MTARLGQEKAPLKTGGPFCLTRLEASARPSSQPGLGSEGHEGFRPSGQVDAPDYFFLTGFFVAFFFAMVLFSFGFDLAVLVPGFFVIGIRYPPLRSLLLASAEITDGSTNPSVSGIIEMRYGGFKSFHLFL